MTCVIVEKLVEWRLAGETEEVLEENLSQRHFLHHKSHVTTPGFEHSEINRGDTQTHKQHRDCVSLFLFFKLRNVGYLVC
jgi:hypothetical protein